MAISYGARAFAFVYLVSLLAAVVLYKVAFIQMIRIDPYFAVYGLVVCAYIVSRFMLSVVYRSTPDAGIEPTVAVVTPAYNEEAAIADSIRAVLALDYPEEKLQVVVIDDGSTDRTLEQIRSLADHEPGVQVVEFPQ